ncbi:MAG: hypothetical protein IPK32_26385 [Verrucomicrobiaceae bacterium]|nr:hypothetical protein [Verrucomicrobiaceae bacterium]
MLTLPGTSRNTAATSPNRSGKVFHIGHGNEGDPQSFSVPHFKDKGDRVSRPREHAGRPAHAGGGLVHESKLDRIRDLCRVELPSRHLRHRDAPTRMVAWRQ